MRSNDYRKKIQGLAKRFPQIALAYLFGSRAAGRAGPLSDFDIALYLDEKNPRKRFALRLTFIAALSKALKTEAIDVVIINDTAGPEFKYQIVSTGELIFEREPFKVIVEPRILNEYFDFHASLVRFGLTKA